MLERLLKYLIVKCPIDLELAIFMLEEIVKDTSNKADANSLTEVVYKLRSK